MTWLPDSDEIDKVSNVRPFVNSAVFIEECMKGPNFVPASDLTFMIPLAFDSVDRLNNFCFCFNYLLFNTSAKVVIYWAEPFEKLAGILGMSEANQDQYNIIAAEFLQRNHASVDFKKTFLQLFVRNFVSKRIALPNAYTFNTTARALSGNDEGFYSPPNIDAAIASFISRVNILLENRPEEDPFHRTRYLNQMLLTIDTPFVANHDADVLLPNVELITTLGLLRNLDEVDFVYPYGHMENSKSLIRIVTEDSDTLRLLGPTVLSGDLTQLLTNGTYFRYNAAYGQTIFAKTNSYKTAGGENEEFISWGAEDVERYIRFSKLNYGIARVDGGVVLHLEHTRGNDSSKENPSFLKNEELWASLQKMNGPALLEHYRALDYIKHRGFNMVSKPKEST